MSRNGKVISEIQTVSVFKSMKAVPIGGAYAYFEENANASIKPGKRANVVILGKSPFEAKPMGIKDSARCRQLRMGITVYIK